MPEKVGPSLSVVIPALNEEGRLPSTLELVCNYLRSGRWRSWEVVVVDDGSSDKTADVVESYHQQNASVRLLRNGQNCGKGYSVRRGLQQARGEWILFTDADLSAPIDQLDLLFGVAQQKGAQVVIGSRALDRSLITIQQSWFRQYAGRCFNSLVQTLTNLPFEDTQCGFKLFHCSAGAALSQQQRIERWAFDVEQLFLAQQLGFKAVEVPVRWAHAEGTKVKLVRDSLNMLRDVVRIRWYHLTGAYEYDGWRSRRSMQNTTTQPARDVASEAQPNA